MSLHFNQRGTHSPQQSGRAIATWCALVWASAHSLTAALTVVIPQVGATETCQEYLHNSWAVCSNAVRLGTGHGSVAVSLPQPLTVANFTATPSSITSTDNPARMAPISLATQSRLSLQVAFNDGTVRDFSGDSRVVYSLADGPSLCQLSTGERNDSLLWI